MKDQSKTDALTDGDLDKIAGLLDKQFDQRIKPFVEELVKDEISGVRADMKHMESNLKGYINEGVETVMSGLDNLSEDVEKRMVVVERKVGIK
jgi:hypothetical protein